MASAIVNIATEIEVDAAKVLAYITRTEEIVIKRAPAAIAALGVAAAALTVALKDCALVAGNPTAVLNIEFDHQTLADLKAVWGDVEALLAELGIKLPAATIAA